MRILILILHLIWEFYLHSKFVILFHFSIKEAKINKKIFPTDKELLTMSNTLLIYSLVIKLKELNAVWAMNYEYQWKTTSAPLTYLLRLSCALQAMPFCLEALWL